MLETEIEVIFIGAILPYENHRYDISVVSKIVGERRNRKISH